MASKDALEYDENWPVLRKLQYIARGDGSTIAGQAAAALIAAEEALAKVRDCGHNDDCLFCALKDTAAGLVWPVAGVGQQGRPE